MPARTQGGSPMADATKQANFRLSTRHIDIINSLAASERVTKAAVVEHALELLEREVEGGLRLHSNAGGPTRQANFRLSVHHVQIIDRLAARGGVTKAAVVEQALELAQQEVANGGSISAGDHRAVNSSLVATQGSAALKVSQQEEAPVLLYVANQQDQKVAEEPKPAAQVETQPQASINPQSEPKPEGKVQPEAQTDEAPKQAETANRVSAAEEGKPQPKASATKEKAAPKPRGERKARGRSEAEDDEDARGDSRDQREERGKRRTYRARREEALGDTPDQSGAPLASPFYIGGYPYIPMPQPAAVPAQAPLQPAAMAPAPMGAPAATVPAPSQKDTETAVLEERLTNQIEALKQALEAKDARIDAMLKQMDDRRQDDKDARLEALIAQIAEANKRQAEAPAAQAAPAPAPEPKAQPVPAPAPAQSADPRIDEILRRLDSAERSSDPRIDQILRQLDSQKPEADPRIDQIMRQLDAQKSDDRDARLESMIRDLADRSQQASPAPAQVAPTQPAGTMRADDIMQIINALKPAQSAPAQAAAPVDSSRLDEARSTGRAEGRREAQAEDERKLEDVRREAKAESDRKLDDLRREYERRIEEARREGYDQGRRDATADNEKLLAEARTSGAFYERAKIANMRGLVFGEKRRYLKVHVTM